MAVANPKACRCREPFRGRSGVLFRKAGGRADARTRLLYKKRAAAPRLGVAAFFQPRAQPVPGGLRPPCSMSVGSRKNVIAGFPEKENRLTIWGQGNPSGVCILFPPREKGCGRAFDIPFSRIAFFMRGHTATKSGLSATFFLRTKKEGKDVPRGSHLAPLML